MTDFLTLPDQESVLWSGHPSWWSFAVWFYIAGLLLFAFGLGLLFFAYLILLRQSHVYTVTNRRIILRRGIFRREVIALALEDVESVTDDAPDLPIAPGIGNITVCGAGKVLRFEAVPAHGELKKMILGLVRPEE